MLEKALTGDRKYWSWIGFLLLMMAAGTYCYLLQLDQVRTELFIIPAHSQALASQLQESHGIASEPVQEAVRQLMHGIPQLTLHPCVKGPFHDAMQVKLAQLARTRSNEVISLDFDTIAAQFLEMPSPGAASP